MLILGPLGCGTSIPTSAALSSAFISCLHLSMSVVPAPEVPDCKGLDHSEQYVCSKGSTSNNALTRHSVYLIAVVGTTSSKHLTSDLAPGVPSVNVRPALGACRLHLGAASGYLKAQGIGMNVVRGFTRPCAPSKVHCWNQRY